MTVDVAVLRVFTDSAGNLGNPLGVVDAATVPPADRQRIATGLGYSETIFIDLPEPGSTTAHAHIFTPAGRHVTSLHLDPGELQRKSGRARWQPLPPDRARAFRQAIREQG